MIKKVIFLACVSLALPFAATAKDFVVLGKKVFAGTCEREASAELMLPDALQYCDRSLAEEDLTYEQRIATIVNRGVVKYRSGDLDGAMADFEHVLGQQSDQPDALINKGLVTLSQGGSPGSALALLNAGIAGGPSMPWVGYYGRAFAFEVGRNDALAYRDYKQALELRPGFRPAKEALSRFTVR